MEEQLSRFPAQLSWEPEPLFFEGLPENSSVVICGMGGSHLGARLLASLPSCPPLLVHSDYGLPKLPEEWTKNVLYIISSYSGETEEALDSANAALQKGARVAIMTSGGALLELSKTHTLPLVLLPKEDLEPRMAMGYQMLALARLLQNTELESHVRFAGRSLSLHEAMERGAALAETIGKRIPLFYASAKNHAIAYHLKADLNETGKIPSFYNLFPELCHNELSAYEEPRPELIPIFILDEEDDPRIQARMKLMQTMFAERSVDCGVFTLYGETPLQKMLSALMAASAAGLKIAARHHQEDAKTPLIAEFKRRLESA